MSALPGDPTIAPGCRHADYEDRERQDDEQWWEDWNRKHGGTEPEDLEER